MKHQSAEFPQQSKPMDHVSLDEDQGSDESLIGNRPLDSVPTLKINELPSIETPDQIVTWFSAFLEAGLRGVGFDKKKDPNTASKIHKINEIALTFIHTVWAWERMFWGGNLPGAYTEALFFSESSMLEMTNDWWIDNKPKIHPSIVHCRQSLQTVNLIDTLMTNDKLDEQMMTSMFSEFRKRYDFLPWLVLIGSGNMSAYLQARIVFSKFACSMSDEVLRMNYETLLENRSDAESD